ncbi:DUF4064 domain-containing protein [Staphylococcus simiae]|uniref:DUF4064 domain-containing protein n=1 Tax=Staphylococcus simiae CCM 7213 = CCUG 51256 TaxID=911238 RepID=G5JJQ6_9STAP|nr:DUF4064 domain-containing protein [Staphylococcus simiae]EHJ07563.1 hypothetical protein SS7213T_08577 [Staphylococcus simiae CCM 7213 = CCUG 51256]PNZ14691.1 DUF4064 domain-containing protein [Staphylococcus simiae]SNV57569.1 membrane protein [Staphylococcus simiae]
MDKKAEKILTWIGVGFQALGAIVGALLLALVIIGLTEDAALSADESLGLVIVFIIGIGSWVMLIAGIIAGIKINKSPKGAGVTLVVIGALSFFFNFISGVLWLIAGILLLTRTPNPEVGQYNANQTTDTTNEQSAYYDHSNQETQQRHHVDDLISEHQNKDQDPYKY